MKSRKDREGTPNPLIRSQGQNGTLTRMPNHFEARLLFLRQWKVYVVPTFRHKTSTAEDSRLYRSALILQAAFAILISGKTDPYTH
jgi:hypothetical protein